MENSPITYKHVHDPFSCYYKIHFKLEITFGCVSGGKEGGSIISKLYGMV